jgi:hypothetical protein
VKHPADAFRLARPVAHRNQAVERIAEVVFDRCREMSTPSVERLG